MLRPIALGLLMAAAMPARADGPSDLIGLINAFRAAPGECGRRSAQPVAPLARSNALSSIRIGTGTILQVALENVGYNARHAEAITVSGPGDAGAVMELIERKYCTALLGAQFTEAGVRREGGEWQIVLAQPVPAIVLPEWDEAGREVLDAVNAARAVARSCGGERFGPAAPVAWNQALGEAALAHSRAMVAERRLAHQERDGSQVGDRASRVGYRWMRIGENIASGQPTAADAVANWLSSPGHCANIMHPGFTEMGAGYAINPNPRLRTVYWTQVFGIPR